MQSLQNLFPLNQGHADLCEFVIPVKRVEKSFSGGILLMRLFLIAVAGVL